jgi:hypothetical protein
MPLRYQFPNLIFLETHLHHIRSHFPPPPLFSTLRLFQTSLTEESKKFHIASQVIMQDARPDIRHLHEVLSNFRQFRKAHHSKYQAAYIDLSLPQLIGPFLRLDLLPCFFDFVNERCSKVQ